MLFGAQTRQFAMCLSVQLVWTHVGHVNQIVNAELAQFAVVFKRVHVANENVLAYFHQVAPFLSRIEKQVVVHGDDHWIQVVLGRVGFSLFVLVELGVQPIHAYQIGRA